MSDILLEMRGICKSFPGVRALDGAHLVVKRGSVHALMGENGAGKSTLMKCLFGIYKKDGGSIICRDILKNPPSDPNPSPRTLEYYNMCPCERMVFNAASIMEDFLAAHPLEEN